MLHELSFSNGIRLRQAEPIDHPFMEQLFRSTRKYLYQMDMPKQYIDVLVSQQYQDQLDHFQTDFPDAAVFIVLHQEEPIGRMILQMDEAAIYVLDLCMVTGMRGKGYGTSILRALQTSARQHQQLLWLSVDRQNQRALKRYLSLGFEVTNVTETHESLVWLPSSVDLTHA